MATIFTHPVVALGLSPYLNFSEKRKQIIFIASILTILPDIDVVGFRLGVPYLHLFGHRGFTHSMAFAVIISFLMGWFIVKDSNLKLIPVWLYFFISTVSHGLLDALTNGGYGIAFFSPFSNERYFFYSQPIEVSTLSIKRFFSGQGSEVLLSELIWIWLPLCIFFVFGLLWRKRKKSKIFE